MINLNDVLLAASNIPVDDPIAEIWGRGLQGRYKIIEYTDSLPITINADGNALIDYRIYGTSGGVGEPTENLIDASKSNVSQRVELEPNTDYCLCKYTGSGQGGSPSCYIYDENDNRLFGDYINVWVSYSFKNPSNGAYAIILFNSHAEGKVSFTKGRATNNNTLYPTDYIPYGYKLPMTVQSENLFDPNDSDIEHGCYYNEGNEKVTNRTEAWESGWIPVKQGVYTLYLLRINYGYYFIVNFYDTQKEFVGNLQSTPNAKNFYTVTVPSDGYVRFNGFDNYTTDPMIAEGSVSEYIPPIKYDVPVYIGENQLDSVEGVSDYVDKASDKIVRMIGEYTFTGDESFNKYGNSDVFYTSKTIDPVGITTVNTITMRCNHPAFTVIENKDTRYWLNPEADDICCFLPGGMSQVFLRSTSNFTTAAECKAYLKAQYDNGTPVKISYWLKTPIEEDPPVPFPEIPTIKGETVIDYDGEPKPSQMYIKYKGKG